MLTNLIFWIILGALAGWIASMVMGRNAQMGALANIIVGIIGALIGGFIMNAFGGQYNRVQPLQRPGGHRRRGGPIVHCGPFPSSIG